MQRFRWVGSVLAVTVGLGMLGFWYISAQRSRLDDANRRELARVARNLESILKSLSSSSLNYFRTAVPEPERSKDETTEQYAKRKATWRASITQLNKMFSQRNPYVVVDSVVVNDAAEAGDALCARLPNPRTLDLLKNGRTAGTISVDTVKIFDDVQISDTFEYLFIASDRGAVVVDMAHGAASHREGLGWLDQQGRASMDRVHPSIGVTDLGGLVDESIGKPIAPTELAQASGTRTVLLGATRYQLFSYPFAISSAGCDTGTTRWIVGGLVDPLRMWREAATLAPRSTLLLLLLLLLPFFAEPAIKLLLLRSTERLRYADVCLMLPNTAVVLMVATVLLLDVGASDRLAERMRSDLSRLADAVDDTLTGELRSMRDQLTFTDRQTYVWPHGKPDCESTGSDVANLLDREKQTLKYRSLWLMFWLRSDGQQMYKRDVHQSTTRRTNLSARKYFQAVRDRPEHLWEFQPGPDKGPKFHVESVRSINTGELTTVLAIQSEASNACNDRYVAAISGPPVAVEHPLLPDGFEFAVVAADGQVLYHSDRRRTLKENLFEEVSDPHAVRAAMVASSELHLSTTYGRRPVDLYLRPFRGISADWFVATVRDREWRETISTEALVRSTFFGMLSWLPLLAVTLWAFWTRTRQKVVGLVWPDRRRDDLYLTLTLTNGGLSVVAAGFMWALNPTGLTQMILAMTLPLVSVVVTVVAARRASASTLSQTSAGPGPARWYVPAVGAFLVAAAVVPAAGLYRHSWHVELGKLDRYERHREGIRARDWMAEDRDRLREINGVDDNLRNARIASRTEFSARYGGAYASNALDLFLDRQLPFYNETLESLRYQAAAEGTAPAAPASRFTAVDVEGLGFSILSLLLSGAVIAGVVWWLRFAIRSIFWTALAPVALAGNRLVVLVAPSLQDKMRLREFCGVPAASGSAPPTAATAPVVIDFEEEVSKTDAATTLARLEKAMAEGGAGAVIIAESDPFSRFSLPAPSQPPAPASSQPPAAAASQTPAPATSEPAAPGPSQSPVAASGSYRERWMMVLARCVPGAVVTTASGAGGADAQQAYFNSLWRHCPRDERLMLIHLADEKFANPHNAAAVKRLLARGLVAAEPLRLMSREFRQFVQSQEAQSPDVKQWEHGEGGFGWHQARWVFFLLLVGGVVLAWATGENWIKGATAFLTTLAGGLEAFQKVATATQRLGPAR